MISVLHEVGFCPTYLIQRDMPMNDIPTLSRIALIAILAFILLVPRASAQVPADDFRQNCSSCHTIGGGRLTGPDLKDVSKRKDRAWLASFITDPNSFISGGDPYALKLKEEARGAVMPNIPGMNKARAEALLSLIEDESKLEKSQFKGVQISERPFTEQDVATGRALFTGTKRLLNGGPACISCHTTNDIGAFGGGVLGPDLTAVLERYGGRKTLSAWLSAPQLPTMRATYKDHPLEADEILPLVAYFQSVMQRSPRDSSTARLNFIIIGLGGAIVVLGLFDVFWKKRFRAVRRPMVDEQRIKIQGR